MMNIIILFTILTSWKIFDFNPKIDLCRN